MHLWILPTVSILWLSFYAGFGLATNRRTFRSAAVNDSGLVYVKDSGICETTPGVGQVSGYINIGSNASMVRVFFGLRQPDKL
jgi:hypothetical protein